MIQGESQLAADRKWTVFGIVFLLVFVGFFAANKWWFYPKYTARIQLPTQYRSPNDIPKVVIIKPFEGTLKKIVQQNDTSIGNDDVAENERNPFLWKGELTPDDPPSPPPEKIKAEKPLEIPRLCMIIIGNSGKSVMLNDTLVRQGEKYGGHLIESIDSESVILSGDYGVLRMSMLQRSFGEPQVDILEVTNPDLLIKPVINKKK